MVRQIDAHLTVDSICKELGLNRNVIMFEVRGLKGRGIPENECIKYIAMREKGAKKFSLSEFTLKLAPSEAVVHEGYFYLSMKALCKEFGIRPSMVKQFQDRGMSLENAVYETRRKMHGVTKAQIKQAEIYKPRESVQQSSSVSNSQIVTSNPQVDSSQKPTPTQVQLTTKPNKNIQKAVKSERIDKLVNLSDNVRSIISQYKLNAELVVLDSSVLSMPVETYLQIICMSGNYKLYDRLENEPITFRGINYPSILYLVTDYGQKLEYTRPHIIMTGGPTNVINNLSMLREQTNGGYIEYDGKGYDTITSLAKVYDVNNISLIKHYLKYGEFDTYMNKYSKEHKEYLKAMNDLCSEFKLNFDELKAVAQNKGYDVEDYVQFCISVVKGKCIFTLGDRHNQFLNKTTAIEYNGLIFISLESACQVLGLDEIMVKHGLSKNIPFKTIVDNLIQEQSKELPKSIITGGTQLRSYEIMEAPKEYNIKALEQDTRYNTKVMFNDAGILNASISDFVATLQRLNLLNLYLRDEHQVPFTYKNIKYSSFEEFARENDCQIIDLRLRLITLNGDLELALSSVARRQNSTRGVEVTYRGTPYESMRKLATELDISYDFLIRAVKASKLPNAEKSLDEAIDELVFNANHNYITVRGNRILLETATRKYKSVKHLCTVEQIPRSQLMNKLYEGKDLETAILHCKRG